MALVAVEGVYRDGRVELAEIPSALLEQARVIVTFLSASSVARSDECSVSAQENREDDRQSLIELLDKGFLLGGPPYLTREEIYAERTDRFGR
jgi:hypothetical protein